MLLFLLGDLLAVAAFLKPGILRVPEWATTLLLHVLPVPCFLAALMLRDPDPPEAGTYPRLRALVDGVLFGYAAYFVIWAAGIRLWQGASRGSEASLSLELRFALLAVLLGICVYRGSARPSRWRGPLGWFGAAFLLLTLSSALSAASMLGGQGPGYRAVANLLKPAALLMLAGAAWSARPLRGDRREHGTWGFEASLRDHLPYAPVLLATAGGVALAWMKPGPIDPWILIFGAPMVVLLVARQFLAFQELKTISRDLESKVEARTRALEAAQAVAVRTERMNALAMLGADLAHDLNNSLAAIRATTELVAEDAAEGKVCSTRDLDRLLVASDQAASLSRRMMMYGREDEPSGSIELGEELHRMEDLLRVLLPRRILLRLMLEAGPCRVACTRSQLEQILVNLVSNARDAIEGPGLVSVVLGRDGDSHARIRVQDDGCGIPEQALGRIFDPFYTTKPKERGTGLGLPSVKALIERAGGQIAVESRPGVGTAFDLRFPIDQGV